MASADEDDFEDSWDLIVPEPIEREPWEEPLEGPSKPGQILVRLYGNTSRFANQTVAEIPVDPKQIVLEEEPGVLLLQLVVPVTPEVLKVTLEPEETLTLVEAIIIQHRGGGLLPEGFPEFQRVGSFLDMPVGVGLGDILNLSLKVSFGSQTLV